MTNSPVQAKDKSVLQQSDLGLHCFPESFYQVCPDEHPPYSIGQAL